MTGQAKTKCESRLSRSIVEEAVEQYRQADDSLAQAIDANHMEMRDFVVLSLLADQPQLSMEHAGSALGLSLTSIRSCVERLADAGLLERGVDAAGDCPFRVTSTGRAVTRRILQGGDT